MTRPRQRPASRDRDHVQPASARSEVRRAQEDGASSVLSAAAHRTIRLTELGLILAAACIIVVAQSVLSALARLTIRLRGRGTVRVAAGILLVVALALAAGGQPWPDRVSPGASAILARTALASPDWSAPASPLVEALTARICPPPQGCSQQPPDGLQRCSGAVAVPTSPTAVASATPTPVPLRVFVDPGHGGVDLGAVGVAEDGSFVYEKDVALALALATADHLRADGVDVVLSRMDDSLPGAMPSDYTSNGAMLTPAGLLADLQRRIERANASGAQLLLSIHFNGLDDPSVSGATTIYCGCRPFADGNRHFATLIQGTVIAALRAEGYTTPDGGVIDDEDLRVDSFTTLGDSYKHIAILGPAVPGKLHASNMPGALFEAFYLSNPREASAAMQPDTQDLIATALAEAIEQYMEDEGQRVSPAATAGPTAK